MRLSKNFTLDEFIFSQTATRLGRKIDPSPEIVANLKFLCETVLQPIRDLVDTPMIITSGYRPQWLNRAIGGSSRSQHMKGYAADFVLSQYAEISLHEACRKIVANHIPYDQLIYEFGDWIHVSADAQPREIVLTAYKENTMWRSAVTRYKQGLHEVVV